MAREAIFLGYRRDDTADAAGRIYDALAGRFGRERVFKDVDNLRPGADFGAHIRSILPHCRVALILIGPNWLDATDEQGQRRIEDPNDWVRIEIEIALAAARLEVVPVLVNDARMPRAEELPESLRPILRRHAATIRRDPDFHDDIERLATALRTSIRSGFLDLRGLSGNPRSTPRGVRSGPSAVVVGAALAAGVLAAIATSRWLPPPFPKNGGDQSAVESANALGTFRDCPECPEMVRLPSGTFVMAPAEERRTVRLPAFAVGRYEVTFAEWDACVAGGGCNNYRPNDEGWGRRNRPVIHVSWADAQTYVQWLSRRSGHRYRLPTEAEWEYAARAGATTDYYSWGDQTPVCDQSAPSGANFRYCNLRTDAIGRGPNSLADGKTRPVGSFQPNAFGLYDVHGNVAEWVEDCFDSDCSDRAVRDGGWGVGPTGLRFASRSRQSLNDRYWSVGFRVAMTLQD